MTGKLYNLEYAHIYTDESFGQEHMIATKVALHYVAASDKANIVTSVLIDNYNPDQHTLDVGHFMSQLGGAGLAPDMYAYEADMVDYVEPMLAMMTSSRLRRSYARYIELKNHVPCSFLAAIWYLMRLGVFTPGRHMMTILGQDYRSADELVNVLPHRFLAVEKKVMEIIAASSQSQLTASIKPVFFHSQYNPNRVLA